MALGCKTQTADYKYPENIKVDSTDNYFGETIKDPYRWLEKEDCKDVQSWINAQNEVTNKFLSSIPYREEIRKRLKYGISKNLQLLLKRGNTIFNIKIMENKIMMFFISKKILPTMVMSF